MRSIPKIISKRCELVKLSLIEAVWFFRHSVDAVVGVM